MLRRTLLTGALAAFASNAAAQGTPTPPPATPPRPPPLQPFEPSNALERTFMAALDNEAQRPAFRRQFLESQVALVVMSSAADAPPRFEPLPENARGALVFTSAVLLDRRFGPATPRRMVTGRAALTLVRQQHVIINFGYAPMLMLDPPGIASFLEIPATPAN